MTRLAQWHERMRRGPENPEAPSTWVYDDLWRAACWEAAPVVRPPVELYPPLRLLKGDPPPPDDDPWNIRALAFMWEGT